jgi:hypothetical protein
VIANIIITSYFQSKLSKNVPLFFVLLEGYKWNKTWKP